MSEIVMPKFGLTMTEGLIVNWHRKPGEAIRAGEILFEVETEKVTNEVEAASDGVLEEILYPAGSTVAVGLPIARLAGSNAVGKAPASSPLIANSLTGDAAESPACSTERGGEKRVVATPLARRIARIEGVDLTNVIGSGPRGRIKAADVTAAKTADVITTEAVPPLVVATPAVVGRAAAGFTAPDSARAATARRVQAAKRDIPHFYLTRHADTRAMNRLRADLNERAAGRAKISVTHLLVKALGLSIATHQNLNRLWLPDGILALETAGVGIVTETPQGLRIPVVDQADSLPLDELAALCAGLFDRARSGSLTSADVSGGVISISNVGMFGADTLTPIINPPHPMILGVGAEQRLFRPDDAGQPEAVQEIILTLAVDHRLIDGADAARFLATLVGLLESPLELLRSPTRQRQ